MKARGTLLMALPNKDQLKFHSYQDAKLLMEAIEKRLQKLNSQLEIQGEVIEQEDINLKLLRSLPSEWKTRALIWRNKAELETINNLSDAVIYAFLASQPNSPQLAREDLEQIDPDDLKEMDLHCEMAMLTIRARRFIKRIGRNLDINGQKIGIDRGREYDREIVSLENPIENALIDQDGFGGYDWSYQAKEEHLTNYALMALTPTGSSSSSDSEVDSCSKTCLKAYATLKEQYDSLSVDYKKYQFNLVSYKAGLQSVEERQVHYKKNEAVFTDKINIVNLEVKLRDIALVEYIKKLEKEKKERDELKLTLEKYQNSSKSLNTLLESQVSDKVKTGLGYKAASPAIEDFVNSSKLIENQENVNVVKTVESKVDSVDVKNKGVYSTVETKPVKKNNFSPPIIKDWNSNDESKVEFEPKVEVKTARPCIEKIKFVKTARNAHSKFKAKRKPIRLDQEVAAYPNSDDPLD
nr:ribonuclease H-like domain-containing protein [Tanacetum cinerariifolium]